MPTTRIDDVELFYTDTGEGEPVLFIHGLTWDHSLWDYQVEALKGQWRCIAVDLIGHGQSSDVDHDYSFFDLARYMDRFLVALGIESAHVVGLSMGGMTAMPMALEYPARVRSLVLLDTDAGPEAPESAASYHQLGDVIMQAGWEPVAETVARILFAEPYLSNPRNLQAAIEKLAANQQGPLNRALRTVTSRQDIRDRLGAISVPTTVIVGELDIATTPDKAEAIAAGIPGASLHKIAGAGHHSPLEQPATVTRHIEEHLARATMEAASL
jgi:3-oxoadipate enol-lactonase